MQLTRFTDLGLRVLMYMTQHNRPDPVTNAEIASQFRTPQNHVIKVVNRLAKLGWVETQRGRRGGLRLSVRPADLRLGRALRALEQTEQLVDCNHPPCVLKSRCLLKGALDEALEAFYQKMDERTLADVCKSRTASALVTLHRKYAGTSA
jgi:Rrf2 family transcriptional regulator, nitric oxide-sensitive transcriptional repressor